MTACGNRLIIFVTLTQLVLFARGNLPQTRNAQVEVVNGTPESQRQVANGTPRSEELAPKISSSNVAVNGNCTEDYKTDASCSPNKSGSAEELCPHERKELCLVFALSKIAKVQLAESRYDEKDRIAASRMVGDARENDDRRNNGQSRQESVGPFSDFKRQSVEDGDSEDSSGQQVKSGNIHCRAIRDVYIPDARQKLPAFACKYGNRIFVLSSARFLQDRRSQMSINIDENTFESFKSGPKISRSNAFNMIPALLVLKTGDENYRIRSQKNILHQRKPNYANEN